MQAFTPAFQSTDPKRGAVRSAAAAFLRNLALRHGRCTFRVSDAAVDVRLARTELVRVYCRMQDAHDLSIQAVSSLAELVRACQGTDPEALARWAASTLLSHWGARCSALTRHVLQVHVSCCIVGSCRPDCTRPRQSTGPAQRCRAGCTAKAAPCRRRGCTPAAVSTGMIHGATAICGSRAKVKLCLNVWDTAGCSSAGSRAVQHNMCNLTYKHTLP